MQYSITNCCCHTLHCILLISKFLLNTLGFLTHSYWNWIYDALICPFEGDVPVCCKLLYFVNSSVRVKKKSVFSWTLSHSWIRTFLIMTLNGENLYCLFSKILQNEMVEVPCWDAVPARWKQKAFSMFAVYYFKGGKNVTSGSITAYQMPRAILICFNKESTFGIVASIRKLPN